MTERFCANCCRHRDADKGKWSVDSRGVKRWRCESCKDKTYVGWLSNGKENVSKLKAAGAG